MSEGSRQTSHGTSLICKRVLRRLLVVTIMPKRAKSERMDQESSLTFVDWLLAIDLDPLKTGTTSRDAQLVPLALKKLFLCDERACANASQHCHACDSCQARHFLLHIAVRSTAQPVRFLGKSISSVFRLRGPITSNSNKGAFPCINSSSITTQKQTKQLSSRSIDSVHTHRLYRVYSKTRAILFSESGHSPPTMVTKKRQVEIEVPFGMIVTAQRMTDLYLEN